VESCKIEEGDIILFNIHPGTHCELHLPTVCLLKDDNDNACGGCPHVRTSGLGAQGDGRPCGGAVWRQLMGGNSFAMVCKAAVALGFIRQ
jgi:hypothetical protein